MAQKVTTKFKGQQRRPQLAREHGVASDETAAGDTAGRRACSARGAATAEATRSGSSGQPWPGERGCCTCGAPYGARIDDDEPSGDRARQTHVRIRRARRSPTPAHGRPASHLSTRLSKGVFGITTERAREILSPSRAVPGSPSTVTIAPSSVLLLQDYCC